MQSRHLLAALAITSVGLVGCDAGSFVTGAEMEVPVQVAVELASLQISGVSLEVTGPGIPEPIIRNLPITDGSAVGNVTVLAGSDRAFLLRAFDAQGIETHQGGDTVDIAANAAPDLNVSLTPLMSDVGVGGRIGSYTLTVTTADATLTVGQTAQLAVTVTDAYGDPVTDAQVVWGAANPAIASVDAAGLVEGLVPGETIVAASYKGFSGTLAVSVQ